MHLINKEGNKRTYHIELDVYSEDEDSLETLYRRIEESLDALKESVKRNLLGPDNADL